MKYEIIKGSEKDFEGRRDYINTIYRCHGGVSKHESSKDSAKLIEIFWHLVEIIAERRPITETVWDGEGLPPVGVECEFASHSLPDYWHSGIVRYLSDHTIVIKLTDLVNGKAESVSHPLTMKFRPIRSPEDVAREKITLNMLQYMYSSDETDHAQVCKIYDAIAAGKIPGVKLEGK